MIVVFDWDGTLSDSVDSIVESLRAASDSLGWTLLSYEDYQRVIGLSLDRVGAALYPGITSEASALYAQAYRAAFPLSSAAKLFAGSQELLGGLYRQGVKLAVATGKSREGLDVALAGSSLSDLFSYTVTASEANSKPDPQMLSILAALSSSDPSRMIMVGDSSLDIAMGCAAGCVCVGVSWGVSSEPALRQAGADYVVDSMDELGRVLDELICSLGR